tara:strand:- start:28 stop:654 length:627 start_codon:yes stop_codon:yes gene_type:complete
MKIYFDGTSWTKGDCLENPLESRFSKIICDHYGAEEYNISKSGGCNRAIARNILEHNLDEYDIFIIQMVNHNRTEWYDEDQKKFRQVKTSMPHSFSKELKNYWNTYYEKIYHKEYGITDEKIYYNLLRKTLQNKKHMIVTCARESYVPFDMDISLDLYDNKKRHSIHKKWLENPPYPRLKNYLTTANHPNELGHKIIAEMLIDYLDKT